MSARGGSNPFSRFLAGFQRFAWVAGLHSRAVARSGERALELLGPRRYLAFIHDIAMAAIAFNLAVRVDSSLSGAAAPSAVIASESLYALLGAAGVFGAMRLHRCRWSVLTDEQVRAIVKAALAQTVLLAAFMALTFDFELLSFTLVVANWAFLTCLLLLPRAFATLFLSGSVQAPEPGQGIASGRVPVLLVGAGDNAEEFIKAAERDPNCLYRPVGVVDEMGPYLRSYVAGVEILGRITEIPVVVKRLTSRGVRPRTLVITEDRLSAETMRMLLDEAARAGLSLKRIGDRPEGNRQGNGRVSLGQVPVAELLDRREPLPDIDSIRSIITDARILITGAGSAVGAELAREVCGYAPAQTTLVDGSVTDLFEITRELQGRYSAAAPVMALCDVRDRDHIRNIFARHRPQLVFHAAGMSHDAVAEDHPCEAVLANVMAARHVADASIEFGATAMILVSSVDANRPGNVLAQTRRIAELYCDLLDRRGAETKGATRLVSLRIPDVLSAPGSIANRMERQVHRGGPVQVPGLDIEKRFTTAAAAATAILEAAVMGLRKGGAEGGVFVAEWAEPVRLRDLAYLMIRLAGLVPEKDISINSIDAAGMKPLPARSSDSPRGMESDLPSGISVVARDVDSRWADTETMEQDIEELIASARGQATERVRLILGRLIEGMPRPETPESGASDNVTQLHR